MTDKPLPSWRLAMFASPSAALAAAGLPITMYMPIYYAGELGLGLAAVGSIVFLARLSDVFTDPLAGMLTDNVKSRWGRRRPWIAIGVPIMMLSAIMLFLPERIVSGPITSTYFLIGLVGVYLGYTLVTISLTSWGAELSTDYHRRSQIQGAISFAGLAGSLLVLSLAAVVETHSDAAIMRYRVEVMGVYLFVMLPITAGLALYFVPEPDVVPVPRIGFKKAFSTIAKNKHMVRLLIADLLLTFPSSVRTVAYVFIISQVIERPDMTSLILVIYMAVNVFAVPSWVWISKRIGKHKAVAYGLLGHGTFSLCYLIPGAGDIWLFIAIHMVSGFVYGGHNFLIRSMVADVVDADTVESGQNRAGLFYSLVTTTNKAGMALGMAVGFWILALIGFDPTPGMINDETALNGLRYMFVAAPFTAEAIVFFIIYHYKLTEDVQLELQTTLALAQTGVEEVEKCSAPR
jgi:GPH family glycoside/pentoside/hexuronide:cation symporter